MYCLLQGCHNAAICAAYSFAVSFLTERGFTSAVTGLLIAAGNLLSIPIQNSCAKMADRSLRVSLHTILLSLFLICGICLFLQLILPYIQIITAFLFVMICALQQAAVSLLNSLSLYYINRGVPLPFGFPRGMGSFFFAFASVALGRVIKSRSTNILLVVAAALMFIAVIVIKHMPRLQEQEKEYSHKAETAPGKTQGLFSKYPGYFTLLLGVSCLFVFHTICNSYMINIVHNVGGNESDLGFSLAFAALVDLPMMSAFHLIQRRFTSSFLLRFSAIGFAVKAACLLLAQNLLQIYFAQILQIIAYSMFLPASLSYVNAIMDEKDKYIGQAYMAATVIVGNIIGGPLGGFILEVCNVSVLLAVELVFAALGCLLVVKFADLVTLKNREHPNELYLEQ